MSKHAAEIIKEHAEKVCGLLKAYEPGLSSWVQMFGREMQWLSDYWQGKKSEELKEPGKIPTPDPAHTVPFACVPGKTVVEKFLIQIETPELPNYCECDICRDGRRALWRAIISAQISNRLNGADPFKVHPKKHVLTISAEQ